MGQTITSRLPEDIAKDLDKISAIEQLDKSSIVRRLLKKAIDDWYLDYALKLFQEGKISLGEAKDLSKLTLWAFLEKLHERKIPLHYDVEEYDADLQTLQELAGK